MASAPTAAHDAPRREGAHDPAEGDRAPPQPDEIPWLPPVDPESSDQIPSIRLGETIQFEELGPVIINTDGTTRRIDNWDQMTERERQVTWRRISQRNEQRRKLLLQQQQQQQQLDQQPQREQESSPDL